MSTIASTNWNRLSILAVIQVNVVAKHYRVIIRERTSPIHNGRRKQTPPTPVIKPLEFESCALTIEPPGVGL